ncbi:hypothetical protein [Psychrobacter pygoscelis]|uniref:hypothetical protein n=1 Tax=Psychrobacter pygoscelis TaxID=2488563 RepID=UPI001038C46E|nr:hypothetical protein [Psychrobacter pygoscelis]
MNNRFSHELEIPPNPPLGKGGTPPVRPFIEKREVKPPNDSKHWYQSKTIWFNLIFILASLLTTVAPTLEQYTSAEMYGVLATAVALINALLRLITDQPIKQGGGRG